jgi:hypothetical protein
MQARNRQQDFDAAAASATEKTGIEQTSNLLIVMRLGFAEPALWLLISAPVSRASRP